MATREYPRAFQLCHSGGSSRKGETKSDLKAVAKAGEGWRRPFLNFCLVFSYGYGFSRSDCPWALSAESADPLSGRACESTTGITFVNLENQFTRIFSSSSREFPRISSSISIIIHENILEHLNYYSSGGFQGGETKSDLKAGDKAG